MTELIQKIFLEEIVEFPSQVFEAITSFFHGKMLRRFLSIPAGEYRHRSCRRISANVQKQKRRISTRLEEALVQEWMWAGPATHICQIGMERDQRQRAQDQKKNSLRLDNQNNDTLVQHQGIVQGQLWKRCADGKLEAHVVLHRVSRWTGPPTLVYCWRRGKIRLNPAEKLEEHKLWPLLPIFLINGHSKVR